MTLKPAWEYDEFKQAGTDYSQPSEVEIYDASHAKFRDLEKESAAVLELLGTRAGDVLIDFGAGTGAFAVQAARHGARVYAVDVSKAMLDFAQAKAQRAGVAGITFCHGGFLSFDCAAQMADAIVTTMALHHLPDFWKGIALKRMAGMLKPGGQLYVRDVIIEEDHALDHIAGLIENLSAAAGATLRAETEQHFREEFSTYDWIMDGLLARAGFAIKSKTIQAGVIGTYCCVKNS